MNPELLYPLICVLLCAACVLSYHWGKDRGIIAERIRLTGNSLPRYENPPPPPLFSDRDMRYPTAHSSQKRFTFQDMMDFAQYSAAWDYDRGAGMWHKRLGAGVPGCCSYELLDGWVQSKKGNNKGVPKMENHPDAPDIIEQVDQAYRDQNGRDPLPSLMRPPVKDPYAIEKTRVNCLPSITQDQLIDALMDMRLENFLCAHTIPAHAGTDLYYLSRKETAEYLLDMYHITPKAKH